MKVNFALNSPQYKNTQITKTKNNEPQSTNFSTYPVNYYFNSFKGTSLNKLYDEYNWYIRHDGLSAINSFLKMEQPKEVMNEFLTAILSAKDRGYEFIDSIVNQPRNSDFIKNMMEKRLGSDSPHLMTFMPDTPYYNAYQNFIETKFQNAHTITELIKIRPDWRGDVLIEKFKSLANHDRLKIGNIPRVIPKEHLKEIVAYLRDKMEIGLKSDKKIDNLVLDGRTYEFKFFTEGKSSKNVFGVFIPSAGKKYVIKMESPCNRSLDKPFALGTLAKIDGYLTVNRSRNSAPLCYYDHVKNFSIYKYIEHTPVDDNDHEINTIRKKLPDFKLLGLDYNDTVGFKNLFKLDSKTSDTHYKLEGFNEALNKNEWVSVDNDHVTYGNRLQPSLSKYHSPLPNAMGMFF